MSARTLVPCLVLASACLALPSRSPAQDGPVAERPDTPTDLVLSLIEAFQAGDRAAVEELWARDGGTWTDDEGFAARAVGYQESEFDPESIETLERSGTTYVAVHADRDSQELVWVFMVTEIDGLLRAGGVEVRPAGMP